MEDWDAIAAEVQDAIASVGFAGIITRTTGGPTTPWDTATATTTTYTVTVLDDGIQDRYEAGTLILRKARVLTIGAVGFTPVISDTITLRGVDYEIIGVDATAPGGVDLMYSVEIRA